MPISPKEAREICSAAEWTLVQTSYPPSVDVVPRPILLTRISRSRSLRDKYTDLGRRQHAGTRDRRTGLPGERLNARTLQKAKLFTETLRRFEMRLNQLDRDDRRADMKKLVARAPKKSTVNVAAIQQLMNKQNIGRKAREESSKAARQSTIFAPTGQKRIHGHVAAVTQRRQARRDSRG